MHLDGGLRAWATALVARALERTEEEFHHGPKARVFHALKPFLTGGVGLPSQGEVATRLGVAIDTLRSHLPDCVRGTANCCAKKSPAPSGLLKMSTRSCVTFAA